MTTDLSKQEYLKRYLEDGKGSEKKKRKKIKCSNSHISRIKILDENIDLKSIKFGEKDLDDEEDEPVIAEIIDDRPLEVKIKEMYDASRWKKVGSDADERIDNDGTISKRYLKTQDDHLPPNDILPTSKKSLKNKSRHDSDSDISPSRSKYLSSHKRNLDSDISPQRSHRKGVNKKSKSSENLSPQNHSVKNRYVQNTSLKLSKEMKSSHRNRHDSDSDLSPVRKDIRRRNDSDSDISPARSHAVSNKNNHLDYLKVSRGKHFSQNKSRHDSGSDGSDISPPRNQRFMSKKKNSDSDVSPPRNHSKNLKSGRKNSDSDISPPRVKKDESYMHRHDLRSDDSDLEKNITHFHSKDSKKSTRKSRDSEKSRYQHVSESIQKKERHQTSESDFSPSRAKLSRNTDKSLSNDGKNRPDKTLLGLKAGLQSASTLRVETQDLREREKKHINKLSEHLSGRNAETIVRDRQTGMKRDLQAERLVKDAEEKKKDDHQKKYMEWGKGVEQTENRQKKLEDDLYEMSKPLARYCDDEDLEERLKSAIHEEDPMAEYMRKKRRKHEPAVPMYNGPPPPPNRFGIRPGYRWDGVDRSNGFEKRYFEKNNASKATQEEAYLWSVQDM